MKWRIALLVLVCILGGVLWKRYSVSDVHQADKLASEVDVSESTPLKLDPATDSSTAQDNNLTYFAPITGGKPRPRAPIDPFPRVPKTRNGLPLDNDQFVAQSVEEQRWLDRNGYPNTQQWAAYSTAPEIVLEQAAAHGDKVAEVMLAGRQFLQGDVKAGGKLMTAGMNGSSFALTMLAANLASGKQGNPELGYAISRVIELRGDWRAGMTRDFMFPVPLTPLQKAHGEVEAHRILDSFRRHSPVQPYLDPRPLYPLSKEEQ